MELLKTLTQMYSPSGNENKIADFISDYISEYADEIYRDNMGNLVVRKYGSGKKILLAAHMDEIGVLVNYIDDNGFLRFSPLGGVMPQCALYQMVMFENGVKGVVAYEEKSDVKKGLDFSKMYIDIGVKDAKEAQKLVNIGDSAVFCGEFHSQGDVVFSKAMDNRAGVYALIKVLKELSNTPNDLYFVFTVQEELGLRGAKAIANAIEPDIALCVDVTDTGDTPECNRMAVKLGGGACIKLMDNSIITHRFVNDTLKSIAKEKSIDVQYEVLAAGGTDAGAIHTSGTGVMTGAVSIPTRYIHTPGECVSMHDIRCVAELVGGFVEREL